ncbi:MAG TPA: hypothetical protein RMH99_31690 [Sandaracinaceae bacterium LLY-WYZ-13_1]|nr:hypothetical protein [Sandaracinaceae bacterium LLY-WYZ-13_1]
MKRFFPILALLASGVVLPACAGGDSDGDECDPACNVEEFETCCAGTCVTLRNDEQNCGGCGITCAPGQYCESNTCMGTPGMDGGPGPGVDSGPSTSGCTDGTRCCGSDCFSCSVPPGTDGRSDPSFMNCNGCGLACNAERANSCSVPGGGEGAPRCMCGNFNQCDAGSVCVADGTVDGGYRCTNLQIDNQNCGELGNACAEGESCMGGMCVCGSTGGTCAEGEACCAGSCIDVSSNPDNCGGCGNVCGENAPSCNGGTCGCGTGPACAEAMPASSGGDPGELCCDGSCVAQTASNCGGCPGMGTTCESGQSCMAVTGFMGFGAGICCAEPPALPLLPAICIGDRLPLPGFGDGGLGLPDGGI